VSEKQVKAVLRRLYPHMEYQRWQITQAMAEAARKELGK
jgi:hypothetical protein